VYVYRCELVGRLAALLVLSPVVALLGCPGQCGSHFCGDLSDPDEFADDDFVEPCNFYSAACTVEVTDDPPETAGEGAFEVLIRFDQPMDSVWVELWDLTSPYCEGFDPKTGDPCGEGDMLRPGWSLTPTSTLDPDQVDAEYCEVWTAEIPYVGDAVEATLSEFLSPEYGGDSEKAALYVEGLSSDRGEGWPFGRAVYLSELFEAMERVAGVDHVESIASPAAAMPPESRQGLATSAAARVFCIEFTRILRAGPGPAASRRVY